MANTSLLQVRMDTELKKQAEALFADFGIDAPSAVRLFYKQTVNRKALPFTVETSSEAKHLFTNIPKITDKSKRFAGTATPIHREETHILDNLTPGFGCLKGQINMSDDFDEPLDDFKDYM